MMSMNMVDNFKKELYDPKNTHFGKLYTEVRKDSFNKTNERTGI